MSILATTFSPSQLITPIDQQHAMDLDARKRELLHRENSLYAKTATKHRWLTDLKMLVFV
jgi:hypothetical protein